MQKRNLHDVLKSTAKEAESIGKTALTYFIPETLKSGIAVVKPFLKRSVKRSVFNELQPMSSSPYPYGWPYNYWMSPIMNPWMNNNYPRSVIPYPNSYSNWLPNGQYWQSNLYSNYWQSPYRRSIIPGATYPRYYPQYYYPQTYYPTEVESRTLHSDVTSNREETKKSLKDFQNLISKVDSAIVSYSKDNGVTLNENLKGVETNAGHYEQNEKRSKSPREMQREGIKVITDTFTDFVCGDKC